MNALAKPISFFLIMVTGYLLKQKHFFREADAQLLMKIIMNLTLPMAVIQAFASFPNDQSYLWIILLGFICASIPLLIMSFLVRNKSQTMQVFYMLNVSGFNIGCFALPIIHGIYGSFGAAIACLFDVGNAVMMTGGSYAFTSSRLKIGEKKESFRTIAMKFVQSIPFCTYMAMLILLLLQVKIPTVVLTMSEPLANANAFLAMLMLGILFKVEKSPIILLDVAKVLLIRIGFSMLFAWVMYNYLPYSIEIRKVLAVVVFAPISTLVPVYTLKCHGDATTASFANSLSIIVGLIIMCFIPVFL